MIRAAIIALTALLISSPSPSFSEIRSADYSDPTTRYGHGVLGDRIEYGALRLQTSGAEIVHMLPPDHVFEDLVPRLADVDGDGDFEVIVVETDVEQGASLAIYDETGKLTETPHIGQSYRWLAPVGVADLDRDGYVELAYIDRPHLAKILRVWRYNHDELEPVADLRGLTNHRIGQDFISGGIRDCGAGPEIVTANADWTNVIVTSLLSGHLVSREIGAFLGPESLSSALECN